MMKLAIKVDKKEGMRSEMAGEGTQDELAMLLFQMELVKHKLMALTTEQSAEVFFQVREKNEDGD